MPHMASAMPLNIIQYRPLPLPFGALYPNPCSFELVTIPLKAFKKIDLGSSPKDGEGKGMLT